MRWWLAAVFVPLVPAFAAIYLAGQVAFTAAHVVVARLLVVLYGPRTLS